MSRLLGQYKARYLHSSLGEVVPLRKPTMEVKKTNRRDVWP